MYRKVITLGFSIALLIPVLVLGKTVSGNKKLDPDVSAKSTIQWNSKSVFDKKVTLKKKLKVKKKAVFKSDLEINGDLILTNPLSLDSVIGALSASQITAGTGVTITENSDGSLTIAGNYSAGNGIILNDAVIASSLGAAIDSSELNDGTVLNEDINSAAAISFSKLAALTSGTILVGDSNNVAAGVLMSGDATMTNAGAITISNSAITAAKISDGTITNSDIKDSAGIDFSKLAALTSGQFLVGNSSNVPTAVALSGDATLSGAGALTIGTGAITSSKIFDGTIATGDLATGVLSADSTGRAKMASTFFDSPTTVNDKFAAGSFGGSILQDGSVSGSKLQLGANSTGTWGTLYSTTTYNYDVSTGSVGTQDISAGAIQLPAKSLILNAYYKVNSGFTSATTSATLAFKIENANDLMTTTAINNAALAQGGWKRLTPDFTATNIITTTATRGVSMTIAGENLTGGSISILIEYVGVP